MACVDTQSGLLRSFRCSGELGPDLFCITAAESGGIGLSIEFNTIGSCLGHPLDLIQIRIHENAYAATETVQFRNKRTKPGSVRLDIPSVIRGRLFRRIRNQCALM